MPLLLCSPRSWQATLECGGSAPLWSAPIQDEPSETHRPAKAVPRHRTPRWPAFTGETQRTWRLRGESMSVPSAAADGSTVDATSIWGSRWVTRTQKPTRYRRWY